MSHPLRPAVGIAHRGFSPDGAENSMTAFQAAVDLGYRHLETDVRATGDGVALAFHDPILDRVTNSCGQLRRLSWREVRTARILGREPIPRLDELLSAFGAEVSVNLDVKSDDAVGPTLDAIRRANAWRRVRLAAFSPARLLQLRRSAGPHTPSALTATEVLALRHGRFGVPSGPPRRAGLAAQVPPQVGPLNILQPRFLAAARARGIEVHAWTVNRRAEMIRLLDLGVDAIITDRADLLRDVLRERGQWQT